MAQPAATVHLDREHHAGPIDRRIFGGFLEHLGRAVYEGVYDPDNAHGLADTDGFRTDVLDALRGLSMPVIRYPGGNYVSAYDWKDTIGPKAQRRSRPDFAWRSIESNQFGLAEFTAWCRKLGAQPMMAINLGTGGLADAADVVEYCNLAGGTYWSDRRKEHGQADPLAIKLWCLGNEMDGPWQAGHCPAEVYAQRAAGAAILMRGLDPTIQTVICGSSARWLSTYMHWDRIVLEHCWDHVDYISAHRHSENRRNDSAWFLAEGVEIDRVLEDYAGLLAYVRAVKRSNKRVYISFDEWIVTYRQRDGDGRWARAPHLLEEVFNLEDALVCAQYLSAFVRRADVVKIACMSQIVNVHAPVVTRPQGLLRQTVYHSFALFSRYALGVSLTPVVEGPTYQAGDRGPVPALDVSAAYDASAESTAVFLVNRSQTDEMAVEVSMAGADIVSITAAQAIGGGDVKAANTWDQPDAVIPRPADASVNAGRLRVRLPAPGMVAVQAKVRGR